MLIAMLVAKHNPRAAHPKQEPSSDITAQDPKSLVLLIIYAGGYVRVTFNLWLQDITTAGRRDPDAFGFI